MLRRLRNGLAVILIGSLVVRIADRLLEPVLPLLVLFFGLILILGGILGGWRR